MYMLMTFSLGLAYSMDIFRAHIHSPMLSYLQCRSSSRDVSVAQISRRCNDATHGLYCKHWGEDSYRNNSTTVATLDTLVCAFVCIMCIIYVWSVLSRLLDQPGEVIHIYILLVMVS